MSEAPGGLVEERYIGLMIAVPIFLLINAVLAYFGGRMMSNMQHKSSEDVLTAHYLGGRSFGPILSLGTMVRLTSDQIDMSAPIILLICVCRAAFNAPYFF